MFNVQKAEEVYKRVIELKPDFDKAYEKIAEIYFSRGHCSVSKLIYPEWAGKALLLNPNNIKA